MAQISRRLRTVAHNVLSGLTVADIGSDHGMLPLYLVQEGLASRCVAVEVSSGPYRVCLDAVAVAGCSDVIEVRLGDGLAPICPGEVDVVCVAGMGGASIAGILERGEAQLRCVRRLVLQPNGGDGLLRRHLYASGWKLEAEYALEERGRFYAVLVAERGDPEDNYKASTLPREVMMEAGPLLLRRPCRAHQRRWLRELEHLERIAASLSQHPSPRNASKFEAVSEKIASASRVLELLSVVDLP